MYHPRFSGDHYEMGAKLGLIFKKSRAEFPIKLDSFQKTFGQKSYDLLEKYCPFIADEIKGITDVLKCNHKLFASWMMCMGCCLYIEEERSVELRGCTAFSVQHNGQIFYGRNNDLPPFLRKVSKSIYYRPKGKNQFILNTSSFVNGEEGINEHGLVAAMTFVFPKLDEIEPGLNSLFLVRYILENCSNVDEGRRILEKFPIASSSNLLLTDSSGKMLVVELHPQKMHYRKPDFNDGGDPFIITVNHFTSEIMRQFDGSNSLQTTQNKEEFTYQSQERYNTAYKTLNQMNSLSDQDHNASLDYIKGLLSGKNGFICQYKKKQNFDTIWGSVFDISGQKIFRAEGNPQRAKFKEDKRLKFQT